MLTYLLKKIKNLKLKLRMHEIVYNIESSLLKKMVRYFFIFYTYFFDKYLGKFSLKRRMNKMPLSPVGNLQPERIDLKGKKILIIVSHCDDEVIFAGTLLTSTEPAIKELMVIHEGGKDRNEIIKKIAEKSNAKLHHLKITENIYPDKNSLAYIPENDALNIEKILKEKLLAEKYDYIFTHNEFGEYGHGHHRQVHRIVKKITEETSPQIKLFYFGYAYPLLYDCENGGKSFWPKSLKVFGINRPWRKESATAVQPFSGIFKSKKYKDYFFHTTSHYLPQENYPLMLELADSYKNAKNAWTKWLKRISNYYKYMTNNIQYYSLLTIPDIPPMEYEWPNIIWSSKHPKTKKNKGKFSRVNDVRAFLDDYLIDYLHFEGNVLWIGWNMFCVLNKYKKRISKYCESFETLDNEESRKDKNIYGDQASKYIGDICNLEHVVGNEIFDNIYAVGVLEYVNSIEKAIKECSRILKSGGRILIGSPGADYKATGENRPTLEYILNNLKANNLIPLEIWQRKNPDFYYIHCYKSRRN